MWRHLLNLRKGGKLPKLGPARSMPPEISAQERDRLKQMLGKDIGKRDRLPYTDRFDKLVDEFLAKNSFTEKQTGQATGMFMKANAGKVDAGLASAAIRKRLAGK